MKKYLISSFMIFAAAQANANQMTLFNFTDGVIKGEYIVASERYAPAQYEAAVGNDTFTIAPVRVDENGEKHPASSRVGDNDRTNHTILKCLYLNDGALKCTPLTEIPEGTFTFIRSFDINGNEIVGIFPPNAIEGIMPVAHSTQAHLVRSTHFTRNGEMVVDWIEIIPATPTYPAGESIPAIPLTPAYPVDNCDIYFLPIERSADAHRMAARLVLAQERQLPVTVDTEWATMASGVTACQITAVSWVK